MKNQIPSKRELLNAIKKVNPKANVLGLNDFILEEGTTSTFARIIGVNNYTGHVTLNYTKDTRIDLNSLIKVTNLKAISFVNDTPSKA